MSEQGQPGAGEGDELGRLGDRGGGVAPRGETTADDSGVGTPEAKHEEGHESTEPPEANSHPDRAPWLSWRILLWTPKRCRWDPSNPPPFTLGLNILYAFVCPPSPFPPPSPHQHG